MNIGYPDTKNKKSSPLYAKYDDVVPGVIETSADTGGLAAAGAALGEGIKKQREANKKKKETEKAKPKKDK